jgi:hypothetical protein
MRGYDGVERERQCRLSIPVRALSFLVVPTLDHLCKLGVTGSIPVRSTSRKRFG